VEVKWKSDKQKHEDYIKKRQKEVKQQKKREKPEKLSRRAIEKIMRENQTL
jgi:hypothetical protein